MSDKPTILFGISDTGGGHRSGALAIKAAIEQLAGDSVHCEVVDFLATTNTPLVRDAPDLYDQLSTRWLPVYDFLFRATDGRRRISALSNIVYIQAHRNVVRVLEAQRPKLVVSVHPLLNRLIGNARRMSRLSFRFVSVVTDLATLHAAYADRELELCMVPTQEAYDKQRQLGMPSTKLFRTGFAVHPKFAAYTGDQAEARATLGIAPEPHTILVTSGGVGSGSVRDVVFELHKAFPSYQLMVVTGKNAALKKELERMNLGPLVHLYGFVSNMEVLMAASDIVVTKAGPGTLMEALVMQRPVVVTEAVGVQEEGNIDFVLNHELGAYAPSVDQIVPAIRDLSDPAAYGQLREKLRDAVPRDGAIQIARILLEQLALDAPPRRRLLMPQVNVLRRLRGRKPRVRRLRTGWQMRISYQWLRSLRLRDLARRRRDA